ncbi:MAG: mycoredoxin [Ancrocorticia sp.]|uniref:mycoredoxin n=1 Tax=Ancrocorticia sp. TaxID=2593684 RepID=UPI003F8DA430
MSDFTLYSTTWCSYCKNLKRQLDKAGIADFNEVNIEEDPQAAARVEGFNGGNQTVPTLEFSDGSAQTNPSLADVKDKLAALA